MRKIDKFIDEIQALKAKGYDRKKIDALTEGVNLIAAEYRKRKTKEETRRKAMVEAAGFAQLDKQRKASGLSNKAFVEGVGRTIIECSQPEDIKTRMMESLEKYAKYLTEAATVAGCLFSMEYLNEESKAMLANNDITGLLHKCVLPKVAHQYGDAATAKRAAIEEISANPVSHIGLHTYKVDRKLIDTDHEKLFILSDATDGDQQYPVKEPLLLYYADTPSVTESTFECATKAVLESDCSTYAKQALVEGIGQWFKDKAKAVGKTIDKKVLGTSYYDSPEEQETLFDYIFQQNKIGPRMKFYDNKPLYKMEKTGKDMAKGQVYALSPFAEALPEDKRITKFILKIVSQPNSEPILALHWVWPEGGTGKATWNIKRGVDRWQYGYAVKKKLRQIGETMETKIRNNIDAEQQSNSES